MTETKSRSLRWEVMPEVIEDPDLMDWDAFVYGKGFAGVAPIGFHGETTSDACEEMEAWFRGYFLTSDVEKLGRLDAINDGRVPLRVVSRRVATHPDRDSTYSPPFEPDDLLTAWLRKILIDIDTSTPENLTDILWPDTPPNPKDLPSK